MDISVKFILMSSSHLFYFTFGVTHFCKQRDTVFSTIINLAKEMELLSE